MKRTNGEILRDLRKKNNLTMEELGKKLKISPAFVNNIEKGRKPIPSDIIERMISLLEPTKKDIEELRQNIIEKEVPEVLRKNVKIDSFYKVEAEEFSYPMFTVDTKSNGIIKKDTMDKYTEIQRLEVGNLILKKCIVLKIIEENLNPYFFDGDVVAFIKTEFADWQSLDNNIVIVEINDDLYLKKVIFENGEPYLHSFNERLYPKEKIKNLKDVKYVARPKYRLNINLDNFTL